jgi:hypothetical protein
MITYAAPIWSSTSLTNYRHLQVYQSKCLRVIGNFPRRTPISNLQFHLRIISIRQFTYHLTDKFFMRCPVHPNPLIRNIGNYTLPRSASSIYKIQPQTHQTQTALNYVYPDVAVIFTFYCMEFFTALSINVVSTIRISIA